MRRSVQKLTLSIAVVLVIMVIAGCEEQNLVNTKKSRLVAAQNIELQKQLQHRDEQLKGLNKSLQDCRKVKEYLEQESQKNTRELVTSTLGPLSEAFERLRTENISLKAEIEKLKKQLDQPQKPACRKSLESDVKQ